MKFIFLVGATGTGKTKLAIELAKQFGGEILNCDSIQQYQGFDIGSAKPSPQERQIVPHHLVDWIPLGKTATVGDFYREAQKVLAKAAPLLICVGGTGFYFQALERGLYEIPASDPQFRADLEQELSQKGVEPMWQEILKADPQFAARIHSEDHYRVVRAIEIIRTTGETPTSLQEAASKSKKLPGPLLKIGLRIEKPNYINRIESRISSMLQNGFVEEVEQLRRKVPVDLLPMRSVGYKEVNGFLMDQEIGKSVEMTELASSICSAHLKLAKKQRTWFQRDADIHWSWVQSHNEEETTGSAVQLVTNFLSQ